MLKYIWSDQWLVQQVLMGEKQAKRELHGLGLILPDHSLL